MLLHFGGETLEIVKIDNDNITVKYPEIDYNNDRQKIIYNEQTILVSDIFTEEDEETKDYSWFDNLSVGDEIKVLYNHDGFNNGVYTILGLNKETKEVLVETIKEEYSGKRYVPKLVKNYVPIRYCLNPFVQKTLEEEFLKVHKEQYSKIEQYVHIAETALKSAVELSEEFGMPFNSKVSIIEQAYRPESYKAFLGLDPAIVEKIINISPGSLENEYVSGWEHSSIC